MLRVGLVSVVFKPWAFSGYCVGYVRRGGISYKGGWIFFSTLRSVGRRNPSPSPTLRASGGIFFVFLRSPKNLRAQATRPDPPEFDPDPALRLERALCYTGGFPNTLAFVGGDQFVAFPCNNVVVLMETPTLPEAFPEEREWGDGVMEERGESLTAPHLFLRGHTDTVTRLQLSTAGHLLASAQGDSLGAAGE